MAFWTRYFFSFHSTSLSLAGNVGHFTWLRHSSCKSSATHSCWCMTAAARAALPTPVGACCTFMCPNNGCQSLGFLTCAQLLMCAIAQGCCTDTVRESALKVDWEKNILLHQGLKPSSGLCLAFQSDALPIELLPAPRLCVGYLNVSLYCAFLSL